MNFLDGMRGNSDERQPVYNLGENNFLNAREYSKTILFLDLDEALQLRNGPTNQYKIFSVTTYLWFRFYLIEHEVNKLQPLDRSKPFDGF